MTAVFVKQTHCMFCLKGPDKSCRRRRLVLFVDLLSCQTYENLGTLIITETMRTMGQGQGFETFLCPMSI